MQRQTTEALQTWFQSAHRKSLILRGARQVGKTWVIRDFAKKNDLNLVEINFERSPEFKDLFERSLDPDRVVDNIELLIARPINRKKSLIFFDEIQDCPHAITALKHFTESSSAPPVVAAGSYLGMFDGQSEGVSQPVGYVDEIEMWPLSFQEFLEASNPHPSLLAVLCDETRLDRTLHAKLLEIYREYLFVGGMPEVVRDWYRLKQNGESIFERQSHVRNLQKRLLSLYRTDVAKYHPRDALAIGRTWEIVAEQLSRSFEEVKRFTFKDQIPKKRDYKAFANYFSRLEAFRLVHLSHILSHPTYPLKANKKDAFFKSFYFDTGLLLAQMDYEYIALDGKADVPYKGPVAENFVATVLARRGLSLFSYMKANSAAEIEFVAQAHGEVVPIEVKNNNTTAKSLASFKTDFAPKFSLMFSNQVGRVTADFAHYPIYLCDLAVKRHLIDEPKGIVSKKSRGDV